MGVERIDPSASFSQIRLPGQFISLLLDERRNGFVVEIDHRQGRALASGSYADFMADWTTFSAEDRTALDVFILHLTRERTIADPLWRLAFGRLAFFFLRAAGASKVGSRAVGERLAAWLGVDSAETGWRVRYDPSTTIERRVELLSSAVDLLCDDRRVTSSERREAIWWTSRCLYEAAADWWKAGGANASMALAKFNAVARQYLSLLKEEPRQQELDRFLGECGSSIEDEVSRVFGSATSAAGSKRASRIGPMADEATCHIFFFWFLKRYDFRMALRMGVLDSRPREKQCVGVAAALMVVAVALFLWNLFDPSLTKWLAQVGFQAVALGCVVIGAPTWFRLAMPRAFLGSLVAWLTLIFALAPNLGLLGRREYPSFKYQVHEYLVQAPFWTTVVGLLLIGGLAWLLMMNETGRHVRSRWVAFKRSAAATGVGYGGAFFWSAMFNAPLRILMAHHRIADEFICVWPILFIGGALALLLGILVELVWEDKAITEPLGEPV